MDQETQRTFASRIAERIFPRMPDFYGLLNEQCRALTESTAALVQFMQTGEQQYADRVRALEHEGDQLKQRNLDILHRAFSTPMDREDIYRAVIAIDNVLNYAKSTVREMTSLGLPPDNHTLAMAELLELGGGALRDGFASLEHDPQQAEAEADRARKTERETEKVYRAALAELFDADHYLATLTSAQREAAEDVGVLFEPLDPARSSAMATGLAFMLEIMKRREIYRHMSNAADRVAAAGEVLRDIIIKVT